MTNIFNKENFNKKIEHYKKLKKYVMDSLRQVYLFTTPNYGESMSLRELLKKMTETNEFNVDEVCEYLNNFIQFYTIKEMFVDCLADLPSESCLDKVEEDIKKDPFYNYTRQNNFFFKFKSPYIINFYINDLYDIHNKLARIMAPYYDYSDLNEAKKFITARNEETPIVPIIKEFFLKLDKLNKEFNSIYPDDVITDILNCTHDGSTYNTDGELISIKNFDND